RDGPADNCRRCSTGGAGMRTGRRRATATPGSRPSSGGSRTFRRRKVCAGISRAARSAGSMLRVAIVGCGKIADAHASQIQRIAGCEIVGVCDTEPLMAAQLYQRFPIGAHFSDVNALITDARPDVVHITTPPESHFDLARWCLERGCHVYVEKPFTLCTADAESLIALATRKGLKLTVGHDDQFSHVTRRMRGL